ncbi:NHL domain-containing thioredoxin family protein [Actinocrinis puniceicyclus]|uniref:NHL domain-containing thioredoxin family protein n=1 Tax=Actinocrinis puniceicyclus TaxID=977794 RepID=A0A8J8BCM2_9ACTN|nr:NHL domain-containing thioredoxin family protein [Actinocrinis puniceicyclus]MBS2963261.1 NHL domain-containing thioredoxin family protein [Actinocrinis puniceicyclus]
MRNGDGNLRQPRVRAPELVGAGGWINTGGKGLTLADLRGRCVLLDFWTFCCANCLHVLDELRELEEQFADVLVVVGVHSPKFVHEADHDALVAACARYDVRHPVLDDPGLTTWKAYAVRAWPTLSVIDPEGYVVAQMSGEGHAHGLRTLLSELVTEHEAKGTLRRGDSPYVPPEPEPTALSFPGKVIALPGGTYLVSDTAHHSVVELAADGESVLRRFGSGERGLLDGEAHEAWFSEPQGLCLLDEHTAVVADSVNHALRAIDLRTGEVTTLAGTGRQWSQGRATSGPAREVDLSSPWDLVVAADGRTVIAMAGIHQLWAYDPASRTVSVLAGTTNEGLVDGAAAEAWFSQPSGLTVDADGVVWVADSESSALRRLDLAAASVTTVVGHGLFDFGLRDGAARQALLQHPLGVTALPDGSIAISDTYNGAIRRFDPATDQVSTLITGLREPSDAVLADGDLLVVESAAHRLTRVRLPEEALRVESAAYRTQRPATDLSPGELELSVVFEPPAGQKLDERYGPSTQLVVSASPPQLLSEGAGRNTPLRRTLVLDGDLESGVLHVSVRAASCDEPPPGAQEDDEGFFPACHVHQQDWGIPVRLVRDAPNRLSLILRGTES